jgi:hypothetical protein
MEPVTSRLGPMQGTGQRASIDLIDTVTIQQHMNTLVRLILSTQQAQACHHGASIESLFDEPSEHVFTSQPPQAATKDRGNLYSSATRASNGTLYLICAAVHTLQWHGMA